MEDELKKVVRDNYGINIENAQILSGGWMNKKYAIDDEKGKKYMVKLFSPDKVKEMSNGEFSTDYLDNQIANNLKIENFMHELGLNCERINLTNGKNVLCRYGTYRVAVIDFLDGEYISRDNMNGIKLHNLGQECAKMHQIFQSIDSAPYIGNYLKIPTIEQLYNRYQNKANAQTNKSSKQYSDLLYYQKMGLLMLEKSNILSEIPICLTHGDFADDNILFLGNIPYILDFELVRLNSPLLDIGRILMSYCFEENNLNYKKIEAFMLGYNKVSTINEKDILLSFVTLWVNEVDMWIKENYFNKEITAKAKRFQEELIYLTYNLPSLIRDYKENKELKQCCKSYSRKRSVPKC